MTEAKLKARNSRCRNSRCRNSCCRNSCCRNARQRGATVAELAILSPVLFLLTLGAFELARGVWIKHTLSHLARETARWAAVRSVSSDDPATTATILARAQSEAVGINTDNLDVDTTWTPSNVPGGTVQIQVSYTFAPVTPLLPFEAIELTSNSRRVIAY